MAKRREFSEEEELSIIEYYKGHADSPTGKKFHVHFNPRILEVLNKYNIKPHIHEENMRFMKIQLKQTCLEKYGVENPFQSEDIKNKIKEINLEKYGVENPGQAEVFKQKIKTSLKKHYGVEHALQSSVVREKYKMTCIDKFGESNPSKCEYIKDAKKDTLIKHYGYGHTPSKRYLYNDIYFDSFPELCFYKYYIDRNIEITREPIALPYSYNDRILYYYPDFSINGELYEIKGNQFVAADGT